MKVFYVMIQTSVFQIGTRLSTDIIYFFKHFDILKSKFKQVVFDMFNFV